MVDACNCMVIAVVVGLTAPVVSLLCCRRVSTGDYPHGDVADLGAGHIELPAAEMGNLEDLCKVGRGVDAIGVDRLCAKTAAGLQGNTCFLGGVFADGVSLGAVTGLRLVSGLGQCVALPACLLSVVSCCLRDVCADPGACAPHAA